MIRFRDFLPAKLEAATLTKSAKLEDTDTMIRKIDAFVAKQDCEIINIETVALPSKYGFRFNGNTDMHISLNGLSSSDWFQVFRL